MTNVMKVKCKEGFQWTTSVCLIQYMASKENFEKIRRKKSVV